MNSKLTQVRELLLTWFYNCEDKRNFESIRKTCSYLDSAYELGLGKSAIWELFDPLVRHGVLEFAGNGYYAIPEPVVIKRDGILVFTYNKILHDKSISTPFNGIYRTNDESTLSGVKLVPFDAHSILRTMPSVDKVVESFPESTEDMSNADFYHWKGRRGLTKRPKDGLIRYFYLPEKLYIREIPDKNINPDAFHIAYSFSRAINCINSGTYYHGSKKLVMERIGLPILLERILFLESMTLGFTPNYDEIHITFEGIHPAVAKEASRILCKTIAYE